MPRLSKHQKSAWAFFIHSRTGRRTYNELCRRCVWDCKQSYRATVVACPFYHSKRAEKGGE